MKLVPRGDTTVVDAYLSPVVGTYLERVASGLESGSLLAMTSAGGLLDAKRYRPKDSLLKLHNLQPLALLFLIAFG